MTGAVQIEERHSSACDKMVAFERKVLSSLEISDVMFAQRRYELESLCLFKGS